MNISFDTTRSTNPVVRLPLDESLLRAASLRSTGATVHAVRGLTGLYTLTRDAGMRSEFEAAERRLRQFVATGIIPET